MTHPGKEITDRMHDDQPDAVRFAWQEFHSIDYGRAQIDLVVDFMWQPEKHKIHNALQKASWDEGKGYYRSPANAAYKGYVAATQANKEGLRKGSKKIKGEYSHLGFSWWVDTWNHGKFEYGMAASKRKDGRYNLSYVTFFKKRS